MNGGASPLMLRRRLRTELRKARLNNNLTQDQVAKAMEWSLSKMNRIEQAKSGIQNEDIVRRQTRLDRIEGKPRPAGEQDRQQWQEDQRR